MALEIATHSKRLEPSPRDDVTPKRSEAEDVSEGEAQFCEITDGLPLIVWVHDAAGAQKLVNATFCEFFGVSREALGGDTWQAFMHPDDVDRYTSEFFASIRERRSFHAEARVKAADGTWRWLESWGRPRTTSRGEFRGMIGTSADVTARKEAEAALAESEERFRSLAENISQLTWMSDADGTRFWYNKRWLDYTGTTLEEMKLLGWQCFHHPEHVQRVLETAKKQLEKGQGWEDLFPLRNASGEYRWFLSRSVPIYDKNHRLVRWLGTNTDVTEQRAAEERLRESDQRKDEYLAVLGHELRNPIAAVRSATELLRTIESDDPRLKRVSGVLERQSRHMARLIDGLLEVSRIARGKIDLDREALDLRDIVKEVLHDRAHDIDDMQINVEVSLPSEAVWVLGDPVRLVQVLDNLIGNSLKFTPAGGLVNVHVQTDDGHVLLRVRDTGVGIGKEMLPRIFQPFHQEAQDIARSPGGLGLGLALCRGLIELHQGTIAVHSEGRGLGAEFSIRLPIASTPASETSSQPHVDVRATRILIVEDNEDAAMMLSELLEIQGHHVRVAGDGRQALDHLRSQTPDIVLCDLGLPGMSGYELARRIREEGAWKGLPLVALTGYGQQEDKARAARAGFNAHLIKPVDIVAIQRALEELVAR